MRAGRALAVVVGLVALAATPIDVASYDASPQQLTRGLASQHAGHEHGLSSDHEGHLAGSGRLRPADRRQLRTIRKATARFHNIANAELAGYVLLKDVDAITCIDMPGLGGMGIHYVKPALVGNPAIRARTPEALVYAPDRDGTLRLAALEYLVDRAAWDAGHRGRPALFAGRAFDFTDAPNRFGLDPFYAQHVWAWKHNRAGLLSMWNPAVHCDWAGGVRR
jgi:hypothetical protein